MRIELAALTSAAPFQAGMLLLCDGRLVLTLDHDDLPSELVGSAYRVKWVGGGQEPGENVWECALREAHEEVGVGVDLVPSPATFLYDWEERALRPVECDDPDPPLLLEREPRPNPDVASAPGLPAGPYSYAATFLAAAGAGTGMHPGDELEGLLLLPLELWPLAERGASLAEAVAAGAELIEPEPLPADARLWVHPMATIRIAVPLLAEPAVREALPLPPA